MTTEREELAFDPEFLRVRRTLVATDAAYVAFALTGIFLTGAGYGIRDALWQAGFYAAFTVGLPALAVVLTCVSFVLKARGNRPLVALSLLAVPFWVPLMQSPPTTDFVWILHVAPAAGLAVWWFVYRRRLARAELFGGPVEARAGDPPSAERGRRIVKLIAGIGIALFGLGVASMFVNLARFAELGMLRPGNLYRGSVAIVLSTLMLIILVFLYRGREWALWLTVVFLALRVGDLVLIRTDWLRRAPEDLAAILILGTAAGILAFSRHVREFYMSRRGWTRSGPETADPRGSA